MTGEGSLFDVPPAAIGRFRVLHQVGAGTCGPVFRAVDPEADTPAAIKLFTVNLPPERVSGFVESLVNLVARMPPLASAVKPLEAGLHGHTPYLATTFAEGDSLDVALKQFGPAALPDLVPRVRALAGVLDAAAARGILHGALHPRDVTIAEAETTLTGLGVWPLLVTHGERLPMRRPYRAPELGENAMSPAGDQFSLAALAFEWMTGRRAPSTFVGGDMVPVPGADREVLADIFARALHPDPVERFSSCGEFVSALADVAAAVSDDGEPVIEARPRRRRSPMPHSLPLESEFDRPTAGEREGTALAADEDASLAAFPAESDIGAAPPSEWADTPFAAEHHHESPIEHDLASEEAYSAFGADAPVLQDRPPFEPAPAMLPPVPPGPPARDPIAFRRDDRERSLPIPPAGPLKRSRSRISLAVGVLLGVVLGAIVAVFMWGRGSATPAEQVGEAPARQEAPGEAPRDSTATAIVDPPIVTTPAPGNEAARPGATKAPAPPPTAANSEPSSSSGRASPQAPPATRTPAGDVGNLLVRSTPDGATVFIDGERRGVTPLTVQKLPLGTRRVRVQRDGFTTEERQVALTRSRPSRSMDVRLTRPAGAAVASAPTTATAKTGTLIVESRPTGATVLLNGRPAGTTPVTIGNLAPGSYTVQLQLADFRPISTTVRVVAGERARVAASLTSVQEP